MNIDSARNVASQASTVANDIADRIRPVATDLAGRVGPVANDIAERARPVANDLAERVGPAAETATTYATRGVEFAADKANDVTGGRFEEQITVAAGLFGGILKGTQQVLSPKASEGKHSADA